MAGGIYLIQDKGEIVKLSEQPYDSEGLLQGLIAKHPDLLAGEQMNPQSPRRWLLVQREASVPAEAGSGGRWSVDHLFLDQDAVPTLVEVKRSSDTRLRREVVGQMLDYAANAVAYWSVEQIQASFKARCEDPRAALEALLGDDADEEKWWQDLKLNLKAGRVRMVFVADVIPSELRRIVEFLNGQMDPAEVLAVEIRQFVGEGLQTLVPNVVGQSAEAQRKKTTGISRQWDEPSFFKELRARHGDEAVDVARKLLDWARDRGLRIWWGRGAHDGSFFPMLDVGEREHWTVSMWTNARIEVQFQHMAKHPPYSASAKREELRARLNGIPDITIPKERADKRPSFPSGALRERSAMQQFLDALDAYVADIRATA